MSNLTVINFFAGPGVGKSTLACELFVEMKRKGLKVELASEYAKDMVYETRQNILDDQIYVLAKQNRRLKRLEGHVDYAISDSPLLLSACYAPDNYFPAYFKDIVGEVFNQYNNVNFYLMRSDGIKYQPEGRTQTSLEEAKKWDDKILKTITDHYNIKATFLLPHYVMNVKKIMEKLR